jgi:hypothetical protein
MITITGLTKRQKRMLNIMWDLDTQDDYFEWYYSLDKELQDEADLLQRMIVIESLDQDVKDVTQASQFLKQFQLKAE